MSRIKVRGQIEIERNIVEKFLMYVKDFLKSNRRFVLYSFLGLIVIFFITMGLFVYLESKAKSDMVAFERIMTRYEEYQKKSYMQEGSGTKKDLDGIIKDLEDFSKSTSFGHSHRMSYYVLGNIYFSEKEYKKSRAALEKFVDKSSNEFLIPIALLKAAVAAEMAGDLDGSLEMYKELEEDYSESVIADQIFYNYANLYVKKGDSFKAKEYFNRVITSYSQSPLARKAKNRLLLLALPK